MNQPDDYLEPGDPVIPLASLAMQSATVAGGTTVGHLLYRADASWLWIFGGLVIGALGACVFGWPVAAVLYPDSGERIVVVKPGRGALPKTMVASIVPSALAASLLGLICHMLMRAPSLATVFAVCLATSVVVGLLFGAGSALA